MSFQAYLDNIQAKTGKAPDDFRRLAARKGLTDYRAIMAWLKSDFELGHGHANVIAQLLVNADKLTASPDDKLAGHFAGEKIKWRKAYDTLVAKVSRFGPEVQWSPNRSYINLQRDGRKFGLVQVSTERLDLGLKLKGVAPAGRLEAAGSWNAMVTHRVRITAPQQIDAEVLAWLKQAYAAAKRI